MTIEGWGYSDAVLLGHLFLPHPRGGDPLLTFMKEERDTFHQAYDDHRDTLALAPVWDRLIPWAYHDWNGGRLPAGPADRGRRR
ncbi:hypothetical protein ACFW6X_30985 [Streptomyces bacillaris]|uniref:hypothetical protein n=1 Tax=Streptomyces bacillaris TaxID=68179 RepID=UPI0036AC3AF5